MNRYSVIYADPPWAYDDNACSEQWRGTPYATTKPADIASWPVHRLAADDCALFMWATYPLLPEALETIRGWGFEYKSIAFQWLKLNRKNGEPFYGLGRWTRGNTEPCLLATRGKPKPVSKGVSQLILEAPIQGHSAKPALAAEKIVELMGDVPRIELFARDRKPGWDCTGLEVDGLPIQFLLSACA